MSAEGIRLEIKGSTFKGDLKQIFGSLLEASAKTFFAAKTTGVVAAGLPNAISALFGALKNVKFEDTNEYRAWVLVSSALLYAIEQVLAETKPTKIPSEGAIKSLAADLASRVETRTYFIEPGFFDAPEQLPLLVDVADELQRWLEPFGGKEDAKSLGVYLARHFASGLHRAWMKDKDRFSPLEQALNSPFVPALRQRQEYDGYLQYLEEQFTTLRLIGQDEEDPASVTLAQVFVPLRAYFEEFQKEDSERREVVTQNVVSADTKAPKRVVSLFDSLDSWIQSADRRDALRIISGGPGIGKSSSMRAFATRVARSQAAYPILIPLQKLAKPDQPLRERIRAFFVNSKNIPFSASPLDTLDRQVTNKPAVLIFDGLDELVRPGKDADEIARDFMVDLRNLLDDLNQTSNREASVVAVVTGRVAAAGSAARALKCSGKQVLFLLRFVEETNTGKRSEFVDPDELLKEDQRLVWWSRWSAAARNVPAKMPKILLHSDLFDVTIEPLLLYFVAFVEPWREKQIEDTIDRNGLYDRLLRDFHQRECERGGRNFANEFADFSDYEVVLQAMAMAAWYDGTTRTGTITSVENLLGDWDEGLLASFRKTVGSEKPAIGAALAFYLRPGERPNSFEFLHKTFAEYLVCRRLIETTLISAEVFAGAILVRRGRKGVFDIRAFLKEWLRLAGSRPIDPDLLRFLREEVRRRGSAQTDIGGPWFSMLRAAVRATLQDGLPAH
jgi:hypothetical protein